MIYQLLYILRRFAKSRAAPRLALLMVLLPLTFVLSRIFEANLNLAVAVMLLVAAAIAIEWALSSHRALSNRQQTKDFEDDLGRHSRVQPASQEEIREAINDLTQQWNHGLRELKETRIGVYELPWFLLIGEQQSGKSTTLTESGLEFPIGTEMLSGAGGTRHCDWWFTNEAVILDIAGRLIFQEDAASDRQEWETLINLLLRHRKECPLNGVVVVIPATSLLEDTFEMQEAKAKNIRKQLMQLQDKLAIRFPIFILITKSDRILGFSELFSELAPEHRDQIFGWSNPEQSVRWDPDTLSLTMDAMALRAHKLRLRLLLNVKDPDRVDRMWVFPEELAALEAPLLNYLRTIFRSSRFEEPFIFRGFYFTSSLQQGRPIAVACRDLLRVQVGDPQAVLEDLETVHWGSYPFFVRDVYEKKILPEQGLVRQSLAALRRHRLRRRIVRWLLVPIGGVALLLLMLPATLQLAKLIQPVESLSRQVEDCLKTESCGALEMYELVYDLEQAKLDLIEARWTLWPLMQSNAHNELTDHLVPALQKGLLSSEPLRNSAREAGAPWIGPDRKLPNSVLEALELKDEP